MNPALAVLIVLMGAGASTMMTLLVRRSEATSDASLQLRTLVFVWFLVWYGVLAFLARPR